MVLSSLNILEDTAQRFNALHSLIKRESFSVRTTCREIELCRYAQCKQNPKFAPGNTLCNYGAVIGGPIPLCGYYETIGGTILGDLRVSKYLIDRAYDKAGLPDHECRVFRSGHLKYPPQMDEGAEATGFKYVSVTEANEISTHLYFQKTFQGANNNPSVEEDAELDVFEFPIIFDDLSHLALKGGWQEPNSELPLGSMLYHSVKVAEKLAKFGAVVMVREPDLFHLDV